MNKIEQMTQKWLKMDKIENVEIHIKMDENEKNSENEKIIKLEKIRRN